jgi:hypothetical protein
MRIDESVHIVFIAPAATQPHKFWRREEKIGFAIS